MSHDVQHIPVLLSEVVRYLSPNIGDRYLDLTAGYGGHAGAIVAKTQAPAILVDRDSNAISSLKARFEDTAYVTITQSSFAEATEELRGSKHRFDIILADLGISSPHIDNEDRGFSLKRDGPLDMRMDQSQALSAEKIVNEYPIDTLVTLLKEYGEEPKAEKIARMIVEHRPITSTLQLADIVSRAWPGYSKVHPATRTFQALRIAVNDELGQLTESLPGWVDLLEKNGRLGIITFHSLEDRIVKRFFKEHSGERYDAPLELLTTKPVIASSDELATNPRARSAKLRVVKRK